MDPGACVLSHAVAQTFCNPLDWTLPGSSVHGILQARTLEWVAMPSIRGSSPMGSNLCLLHLLQWQVDSLLYTLKRCFPGRSDGKESACNAGNLGSIPGSKRSPGEGNGYPLQYSCLENPMDRGAWRAIVCGVTKNQTQLKRN